MGNIEKNWYAVKVETGKPSIIKYLNSRYIEIYSPTAGGQALFPSLVFLHCTERELQYFLEEWSLQASPFTATDRQTPRIIPDAEMEMFKMVLGTPNMEILPMDIFDWRFLEGQKVRVVGGPLKGASGVIKRLKGNRRLIVSIFGIAAVATEYVPQEYIEVIE